MKNRHFEFRVWNTKLNKFVAQATLGEIRGANSNNRLFGITFSSDETVNETQNFEGCVIQQYIGLKDSSGQKIFEGDILEYNVGEARDGQIIYETGPVVFSPFGHGFIIDSSGRHALGDFKYGDFVPIFSNWNNFDRVEYKVVSNIFEN